MSEQLRTRSLTMRLLIVLLLVQAAVPVLGMATWLLFSPYVSWTDVAASSAQARIEASLVSTPQEGLRLVASPALRRYAARRPGFVFAAAVDGRILPGSDRVLVDALARFGPSLATDGQLSLELPNLRTNARFARGYDRKDLIVVTAGNAFGRDDFGGFVRDYLPALLPICGPSLLVALLAVPFVIWRTMRPLRVAAEQAERIEFSALDRRLDEDDVPIEALPLVRAVNAALKRLSQGAERQRLFHANAAHELRTPVAILQARLDAMPELPRGHELHRDVGRIALLVEQLLTVERLAVCGPGTEIVDLVSRVRALVAACAPLAIRSGRQLSFEASSARVEVRGSGRALESAIVNLIDNALRAEPAGGAVEVVVGPGRMVAVIDHGEGIAADDRLLVFEPFWRKDESPPGSGLGLSIVREVARVHGGDVHVRGTPGGGATFVLEFPDANEPPTAGREPREAR